MRELSERDVDGISRRMRLVLRGIEIAHAKREVHRVEVFERRRQNDEMRDEKNRREAGGPENSRGCSHKGARHADGSNLAEDQTFVQAAGAVSLRVDRHRFVSGGAQLTYDGALHLGLERAR